MEKQDVRIITLPAMRVASFYAFSSSPELEAMDKAVKWAKSNGLWQGSPALRIFGFNNPDPTPGSSNYGYELWLTIGPDVQPGNDVKVKDFSGGKYAVLLCDVTGDPGEIIPSAWQKLVKWMEGSHYTHGNHQWLEEHLSRSDSIDQGFVLDLYLPITG